MSRELLQKCLTRMYGHFWADDLCDAIRAHLAQPQAEPVAWIYPSDLEKFQECETFAHVFSIKVGCPDEESVPLYTHPAAPVPEEFDMADEGGCPVCGEDGGTSCGMQNCGLLYADPVPADEMDAVASKYAHKMALDLECVLSDYNGRWWDTAMNTIGEYRSAMNAIHERESPTFMGEPSIAASPEVPK